MLLEKLNFCNLQVRLDKNEQAFYTPRDINDPINVRARERHPVTLGEPQYPVPAEYSDDIKTLVAAIAANGEREGIDFGGVRLRVYTENDCFGGERWASCRRLSRNPVPLLDLGVLRHEIDLLHKWAKMGGLVGIVGKMAAGKTTTWASYIVDLLKTYGGGAQTIEKPIEIVFQGRVGEAGHALQIEARDDEDMVRKIDKSLSWNPRYIGVGETTSGTVAAKVLQVASAGHLLANTWHGDSQEGAIQNFIQRAAEKVNYADAAKMFSRTVTGLVHQRRTDGVVSLSFFDIAGAQNEGEIRDAISAVDIKKLHTFIKDQDAAGERLARSAQSPAPQKTSPPSQVARLPPLPAKNPAAPPP
jgi:twitching motility protein PilT